ncbi:thiamine-monophosphate kinase [Candidatus Omnitrophus magneticus]|uniref:Thiamine-monophosphate kinase n=1 Tax=Candidatus Omnitrophus magneticus TaxID=1609969 RepID=A0A0F0CR86_9BACT|nr:thiamine-monophosphate kinase [Candidatus Omnitrophus magneticus]
MRELKFIETIRQRAGNARSGVKLGIGDDAAVLEYDKSKYLLWADDMLVEGTHFTKEDDSFDVGWKAVAVNISDIAAMGGIPKYITVSLGCSGKHSGKYLSKLYDGIFAICKKFGIQVVGGDTNKSDKFIIDVSIIGFVEKKRLITRKGARIGDLILVTGPIRNGRLTHLSFTPRLQESRVLGVYKITAMIDVSDGLSMDLNRLCERSKVGAQIYASSITLVPGLSLDDALYYGESFELLFTIPPKEIEKIKNDRKISDSIFVIGSVVSSSQGVKIMTSSNENKRLKIAGFKHF